MILGTTLRKLKQAKLLNAKYYIRLQCTKFIRKFYHKLCIINLSKSCPNCKIILEAVYCSFSKTKNSLFMMIEFFLFYFSGYGSQAVSSTTLSSDDSMSLRSISVDDTPDTEVPKSNACIDNYNNQVILLHLHILTFFYIYVYIKK